MRGDTVLAGCVTVHGTPVLVRASLTDAAWSTVHLFGRMEVDDHNNPAVIFWRGRLWAFSSPHSGGVFPLDRHMYVHYRVSLAPYGASGGFGPVRSAPLGKRCGFGFTYPNPVVARHRLYLFLRGPCRQPIFTSTRDGIHWAHERTLILGAPKPIGRCRPYAKYAGGPAGISMLFSEAHRFDHPTSLFHMRMRGSGFSRADGALIGAVDDLPFRVSRLDRVHRYGSEPGRAWPMDIATDAVGHPVAIYSTSAAGDRYWYARWGGRRWVSTLIDTAGAHYGDYTNAGASLSHDDPSWAVVARNDAAGGSNEVELVHTTDGGATFARQSVTAASPVQNFRPVFPRGQAATGRVLLAWISGLSPTFRDFATTLELASVPVD